MILPERVFGRLGAHWMKSGEAMAPISLRTQSRSSARSAFGRLAARDQRDVRIDALTLDVVRTADGRGFRDLGMRHQRAFDFGGAESMARDVEHVVDATRDPVVAVFVAPRAVAGEIATGKRLEVGVDETLVVAEHGAHLSRPAVGQDEVAFARAFQSLRLRCRRSQASRRRTATSLSPASDRWRQGAAKSGCRPFPSATTCRRWGSDRRRRRGDTTPTLPD